MKKGKLLRRYQPNNLNTIKALTVNTAKGLLSIYDKVELFKSLDNIFSEEISTSKTLDLIKQYGEHLIERRGGEYKNMPIDKNRIFKPKKKVRCKYK